MKIEPVPLASLKAPARNVRLHPDAQIAELTRAIQMFGQTRPVVVDEDNTVLAGNALVQALRRLRRPEALVLRLTGLSQDDKAKLMLSDNKIHALGGDDYENIMDVVRGLDDLDIPGFDSELLTSLIASRDVSTAALRGLEPAEKKTRPPVVGVLRVNGTSTVTCPHCGKEFQIQ